MRVPEWIAAAQERDWLTGMPASQLIESLVSVKLQASSASEVFMKFVALGFAKR